MIWLYSHSWIFCRWFWARLAHISKQVWAKFGLDLGNNKKMSDDIVSGKMLVCHPSENLTDNECKFGGKAR